MSPGDHVEDQHYECEDEQKVDHSTAYMQAETEQQQNQENNHDRPKHICLLDTLVNTRKLRSRVLVRIPVELVLRSLYRLPFCTSDSAQE